MSPGSTLIDRCVIGVDVLGYSQRNPRRQGDTQRELQQLLTEAADAAGLDRTAWELFHTGDGELAVLPADVNLLPVVQSFVPALHDLLVLRNGDRDPATKIRLRLAVHIGTLTPSTSGHYAGTALVTLSRLLDSPPVRKALESAERSELALILSEVVHEKVVLSGYLARGDEQFAPVVVDLPAKAFRQTAYVHVPGYDMHSFPGSGAPAGSPTPPPPPETPPPPGGTPAPGDGGVVINGTVHNESGGTIAGRDVYR